MIVLLILYGTKIDFKYFVKKTLYIKFQMEFFFIQNGKLNILK